MNMPSNATIRATGARIFIWPCVVFDFNEPFSFVATKNAFKSLGNSPSSVVIIAVSSAQDVAPSFVH
jgi:hypothetical protein